MPVEPITYVNDFDPTKPDGSAPKSEGDDNIRAIKLGLKNSFLGFTGAILVTGVDGGAQNTYTLTPPTALPAYTARMFAVFMPVASNSGPATLNISGLGAKEIVSVSGLPLSSGDLTQGRFYTAFYDGTKFRLDNVTQNYVDQLILSGQVPGVNDPANVDKFLKGGGIWSSVDLRGSPATNKGNTGTTAQVINYADGEGQTITATGNHLLSATGFPTGRMAGILVRMKGYNTYPPNTTGITWIKADKTMTTNFASSGIVMPADAFVALFSLGDGTIFAKVA